MTSIAFDMLDIKNACKHLDIDAECDFWLESTPNVVYLRFCLYKAELIALINDGKDECIDFEDDECQWHALSDGAEIPDDGLLSCRYILQTT